MKKSKYSQSANYDKYINFTIKFAFDKYNFYCRVTIDVTQCLYKKSKKSGKILIGYIIFSVCRVFNSIYTFFHNKRHINLNLDTI